MRYWRRRFALRGHHASTTNTTTTPDSSCAQRLFLAAAEGRGATARHVPTLGLQRQSATCSFTDKYDHDVGLLCCCWCVRRTSTWSCCSSVRGGGVANPGKKMVDAINSVIATYCLVYYNITVSSFPYVSFPVKLKL